MGTAQSPRHPAETALKASLVRCVYFQCANGVSGDMVLGALVDAGVPLPCLQEAVDALGPEMPQLAAEPVRRSGIRATLVRVQARGAPASRPRSLGQLLAIVQDAALPAGVKADALRVLRRLGEAEARVHGLQAGEELELKELGSDDTLADVVAAAAGLAELGVGAVYASALPAGAGRVRSHHGLLPVPAPAVLELARAAGAPLAPPPPGEEPGELVTPTGAALLAALASFEVAPPIALERVGYGAGSRDPADRPNVLVLWVGESRGETAREMVLVETTIDDMNPEIYGHLREVLMAEGARDVWLTAVQMKKDRPGVVVTAIAAAASEARLVAALFRETSTLGARAIPVRRHEVAREIVPVETPLGPVRVKLKHLGGRAVDASPEYEDCRRIAREQGVPLQEVYRLARRAAEDRFLGGDPAAPAPGASP